MVLPLSTKLYNIIQFFANILSKSVTPREGISIVTMNAGYCTLYFGINTSNQNRFKNPRFMNPFFKGKSFEAVFKYHSKCGTSTYFVTREYKKRVATNPHLPSAAHAPVYWWPPHWFCSSPLHILYFSDSSYGWGGRIRTCEYQSQSLARYHFATPQYIGKAESYLPIHVSNHY